MVIGTGGRVRAAALVRPDGPDYLDALMFLMAAAEVLDAGNFQGWLGMLAPDVTYQGAGADQWDPHASAPATSGTRSLR